jgi:hypothetical protein
MHAAISSMAARMLPMKIGLLDLRWRRIELSVLLDGNTERLGRHHVLLGL